MSYNPNSKNPLRSKGINISNLSGASSSLKEETAGRILNVDINKIKLHGDNIYTDFEAESDKTTLAELKTDYEALVQNIKEDGQLTPLKVTSDYYLIGGHKRLKALKELGVAKVLVIIDNTVTLDNLKLAKHKDNNYRSKTPLMKSIECLDWYNYFNAKRQETPSKYQGISTKKLISNKTGYSEGSIHNYLKMQKEGVNTVSEVLNPDLDKEQNKKLKRDITSEESILNTLESSIKIVKRDRLSVKIVEGKIEIKTKNGDLQKTIIDLIVKNNE